MAEIIFDASDFEVIGRAFMRLPGDIKAKAFARAMRRMRDMARTDVVNRGAERTDLTRKMVRQRTTAYFNAGGATIEIVEQSGWIGLYKLGATQTGKGVRVRNRGSYPGAFIAKMKSGHSGVFDNTGGKNSKSGRNNQIRELFGPNPAHDVTNNPDEYLKVLAEILEDRLLPRVIHELDRLLPR
jgi:hypothetical protein